MIREELGLDRLSMDDLSKLSADDLGKIKFGQGCPVVLGDVLAVTFISMGQGIPQNIVDSVCERNVKESKSLRQQLNDWNKISEMETKVIDLMKHVAIQNLANYICMSGSTFQEEIQLKKINLQQSVMVAMIELMPLSK